MFVQIDGWHGAGKSELVGLLDGHPEIFANLMPDVSHMAFLFDYNRPEWIHEKHSEDLRKLLVMSEYYNIERAANQGFFSFDFSATDRLRMPYKMNFYDFEKDFMGEVMALDQWTQEEIVHLLYKNLYRHLNRNGNFPRSFPKYYVSKSYGFVNMQQKFRTVFPNSKSIFIHRDVLANIATRANRRPMEDDYHTKGFYSMGFEKLMRRGEVEEILYCLDFNKERAEKYPDHFLMVDFDEMNNNTEKVMREICNFMHIDFDPIMLKFTYFGEEVSCKGKKYVGEELDKPEDLLNSQEIAEVNRRIEEYKSRHAEKSDNKLRISAATELASKGFKRLTKHLKKRGL